MTQFIEIGQTANHRSIAFEEQQGNGPTIIWLCGFLSHMASTKGEAVAQWARENNRHLIRFDYSGHGKSGENYTDSTISRWLEEALTIISRFAKTRPILVGSSMGGWLAVLATRALRQINQDLTPSGLVLVAPAIDMTKRLIWDRLPVDARQTLLTSGQIQLPSDYSETPYIFTKQLIEDGRHHLILDQEIDLGCPIAIMQGMRDPDVPWHHVRDFSEKLARDKLTFSLIPDGDHRLSRPQDIALLLHHIENIERF